MLTSRFKKSISQHTLIGLIYVIVMLQYLEWPLVSVDVGQSCILSMAKHYIHINANWLVLSHLLALLYSCIPTYSHTPLRISVLIQRNANVQYT